MCHYISNSLKAEKDESLLTALTVCKEKFQFVCCLQVRSTDFAQHGKDLHIEGGPVKTNAQFLRLAWSKPLQSTDARKVGRNPGAALRRDLCPALGTPVCADAEH